MDNINLWTVWVWKKCSYCFIMGETVDFTVVIIIQTYLINIVRWKNYFNLREDGYAYWANEDKSSRNNRL